MNKKRFSELLSKLISSHGMTPESLAISLNIPTDEMLSYMNGEKYPDYKVTSEIVHALGMTMDDFDRMYNSGDIALREMRSSPETNEFFEKRLQSGKKIVKTIIIIEIIASVLTLFSSVGSLLVSGFMMFLMYKLYHGRNWAKTVYLVMIIFTIILNVLSILSFGSGIFGFISLITIAVQCVIAYVLITNNNVAEFLEHQRSIY